MVDYTDALLLLFIAFVVIGCWTWLMLERAKNTTKRKPTIHTITLSQRLDPNRSWMEKLRR